MPKEKRRQVKITQLECGVVRKKLRNFGFSLEQPIKLSKLPWPHTIKTSGNVLIEMTNGRRSYASSCRLYSAS